MIGQLIYLTIRCPDIFSTHVPSQFMPAPHISDASFGFLCFQHPAKDSYHLLLVFFNPKSTRTQTQTGPALAPMTRRSTFNLFTLLVTSYITEERIRTLYLALQPKPNLIHAPGYFWIDLAKVPTSRSWYFTYTIGRCSFSHHEVQAQFMLPLK